MFLGTQYPRLDDKGRLVLPAKFREAFAPGVVLTKGQDRSIVVWPAAEFASYAERINEESKSNAARAQAYERILFSGASDEIPDKQGRITVPANLRDYASLDRDVVFVGKNRTAEIWNPEAWDTYRATQEEAYSGLDEGAPPGL